MDQHPVLLAVEQRPAPQPGEQAVAVGGRKHRVEGVAALALGDAGGAGQQVEVVIAEHHHQPVAQARRPAQHLERPRAAVDQVSHQPQPVLARRKPDPSKQRAQRLEAPVDVADRIGRHDGRVRRSGRFSAWREPPSATKVSRLSCRKPTTNW